LYSPDLSLKYETYFPSGDHAGSRSADALECVRFLTSPFSAGIVKISPRDSTTTRLPVGERAMLLMRAVTSSQRGIIQGKSPVAVIATTFSRPDFGSSSWICPPCSNTIAFAPASIVFTSKSVNFVTCASFFAFVSNDQTFETPSRSERKNTVSPIQTGSMSFESVHGGETRSYVLRSTIQIGRFWPPR
jgi:hypothetical protein